jgi:hypothetical protein
MPDFRLNEQTGDVRHDLEEPLPVTTAMRSIWR